MESPQGTLLSISGGDPFLLIIRCPSIFMFSNGFTINRYAIRINYKLMFLRSYFLFTIHFYDARNLH